ncbi:MAG: tRNA (adenosine(37)-N6)-threonylcarbamoyltransferase complex transferase subunit TsaD [Patescibacteria group bacterium]
MSKKATTILAIETSCDETAIAVVQCWGGLKKPTYKILSNIVSSQINIHKEFGGVVPNIAKREHLKKLPIVLTRALLKAKIKKPEKELDAIAVTRGPGLEPALWTGINLAQELSQAWNLPLVGANHMEGHIVAMLLNQKEHRTVSFPAIALLVSGGHTELVYIEGWSRYGIIGQTLDDAAGEAFDKVARMMNLSYPGGPMISRLARQGKKDAFPFPRPMIHVKNFNFSFSGLKTAVLYTIRDLEKSGTPYKKEDIAASFETAAVEVLVSKTIRALKETNAHSLILGGGVAANTRLRNTIKKSANTLNKNIRTFLPTQKLTTDNAAMIGAAAYFSVLKKNFTNWNKLKAHATLEL